MEELGTKNGFAGWLVLNIASLRYKKMPVLDIRKHIDISIFERMFVVVSQLGAF
jgi:hypothetical protein